MTDKLLHRCWTKATDREPGPPRYSLNWVVSRRGWLRVFADRLECGDWLIPTISVTGATLYAAGLGRVLVVATPDRTYQFGLNPWCRIEQHLPFGITKERLKLRYSRFSVLLRVAVLAYLLYLLMQWLRAA